MKNVKSTVTVLGVTLVVIAIALLAITYSMGPTVVEKPVYVNRYVETPVPVVVQPGWWSYFGAPWGYSSGYGKPWKMGSGLPGMKVPPGPPPAGPPPPPPPAPAPAPVPAPAPQPPPAA